MNDGKCLVAKSDNTAAPTLKKSSEESLFIDKEFPPTGDAIDGRHLSKLTRNSTIILSLLQWLLIFPSF